MSASVVLHHKWVADRLAAIGINTAVALVYVQIALLHKQVVDRFAVFQDLAS